MQGDFRTFASWLVVWHSFLPCRKHTDIQLYRMWCAAERGQLLFCEHGYMYHCMYYPKY